MAGLSPDQYRAAAGYRFSSAREGVVVASRPAPSNVTDGQELIDGRVWGGDSWSGLAIPTSAATADAAAKVSAVFFCVSLIADTVGSLGLDIVTDEGEATDLPVADVLAYAPNPLQTGSEFWSAMAFAGALRNEAFAETVAGIDGLELWALDPRRTCATWEERRMSVAYQPDQGPVRTLGPASLFWFTGLSDATLRPLTPWKLARGSIDFALALERQGREFFQNGRRISGVLSTDQVFKSQETIDRLKASVREWRNGQTPVLENGLTYTPVSSTNVDSQYFELVQQRVVEMLRYWRIPRSFGTDGATKSTSEQDAGDLVRYVIRPWTRRMEQAISSRILLPDQRRTYRARFNMDSLLRGDSATQWKNAVLARTSSVMSVNELRTKWFGLARIKDDWANDPREPLNSNRAGDTSTGGGTAPQDDVEGQNA